MGKSKQIRKRIEGLEQAKKEHRKKIESYEGKKKYLIDYWEKEIERFDEKIRDEKRKLND